MAGQRSLINRLVLPASPVVWWNTQQREPFPVILRPFPSMSKIKIQQKLFVVRRLMDYSSNFRHSSSCQVVTAASSSVIEGEYHMKL
ncbi:hypothetical protein J6590_097072 [Homalodisca vitripennis]|nr:hypothetical protein J6590_097072 [Homalodisca vitripennis]